MTTPETHSKHPSSSASDKLQEQATSPARNDRLRLQQAGFQPKARVTRSPESHSRQGTAKEKRRASSRDTSPQRKYSRSRDSQSSHHTQDRSDTQGYSPKLGRKVESQEAPSKHSLSSHRSSPSAARSRAGSLTGSKSARIPSHRYINKRYTVAARRSYVNDNSSLLSILSSLTGVSDRSSGSNSTLTQKSFDKQKVSKRGDTSSVYSSDNKEGASEMVLARSSSLTRPHNYKRATVADLHEEDETCSSSSSSPSFDESEYRSFETHAAASPQSATPDLTRTHTRSTLRSRSNSLASSDSNHQFTPPSDRSIRGKELRRDSLVPAAEPPRASWPTKTDRQAPSQQAVDQRSDPSSSRSSSRRSSRAHEFHDSQHHANQYHNDVYYQRMVHPHTAKARNDQAGAEYPYDQTKQQPPPTPAAPDLSKTTLAGYEMLASKLSDPKTTFRPIYRKFDQLNHRVLLHLQDELAELEEQLRVLDECIAQTSPLVDGKPAPASRRAEAFGGTHLHHRRREVLGWTFVKIEQYNRALASYNSLKDLGPKTIKDAIILFEGAHARADIKAYKAFLDSEKPVHATETKFLDHENDLVFLQPLKAMPTPIEEPTAKDWVKLMVAILVLFWTITMYLWSSHTLVARLCISLIYSAMIVFAAHKDYPITQWTSEAWCWSAGMWLFSWVVGFVPQLGSIL